MALWIVLVVNQWFEIILFVSFSTSQEPWWKPPWPWQRHQSTKSPQPVERMRPAQRAWPSVTGRKSGKLILHKTVLVGAQLWDHKCQVYFGNWACGMRCAAGLGTQLPVRCFSSQPRQLAECGGKRNYRLSMHKWKIAKLLRHPRLVASYAYTDIKT